MIVSDGINLIKFAIAIFLEPPRAWPTHIMTFRAVTLDWHYHWVVAMLCRLGESCSRPSGRSWKFKSVHRTSPAFRLCW
jgi:hypothetical protein